MPLEAALSTLYFTPGLDALAYSRVEPHKALIATNQFSIYIPR